MIDLLTVLRGRLGTAVKMVLGLVSTLYDACVDFMLNLCAAFGISYLDANALLFVVLWPLVTLALIGWVLRNALTIRALKRSRGPATEPISEGVGQMIRTHWRPGVLGAAAACIGLLAVTCAYRVTVPTRSGWTQFPLSDDDLHAHNAIAWLGGRNYGRAEVLAAVKQAGAEVRKAEPDARLAILDVSSRCGGKLFGHASHKAGKDVDIAFFGREADGDLDPTGPTLLSMYERDFGKDGRWGGLTFDARTNWLLVDALRRNTRARVAKILVEPHLEPRILKAGRTLGASEEALAWARKHLVYAGEGFADHEDHMHVRFR